MTELSLPPPRDLPPGHLDQRAAHLYSEITRERPRRTRRISVLAIAAACVLLAAALSFALIPKSGNTPRGVGADGPVGGVRLVPETDVVGATFTVFAELNVPKGYGDGTGWISVRRFEGQPGTNPTTLRSDVAFDESKVVYVWFDALISYLSATGWPDEQSGRSGR